MTEEIRNLIRERRRAYESQNKMRYKGLDKQIKRECANAKENGLMTDAKK